MKTGDEDWDQNLKTLGRALFPDPSKAAHAYYYGSEARKAQLDAAKLQDQMAAGHTALGMQFGRVPNPTYQPGFGGTQIMVDPNSQPVAGPAPAAPGPTGLGAAVTAMPPQAVAHGVVAGVENNAQSGTLPPMAPPTPSSPPAPTTTASNGTTPSNSPATLHPGSVTSAGGGGVIMAGPAAADGTPAPAAFNLGQMIALQIAAGATPEAAYATARGTLGNMVKNGQIALPLAEQMAAFYGAPQMRVQTLTNEGNLAVGAQTQAGETARNTARIAGDMARQQVVSGEARRADEFAPEKTVDENGNAIFVSRKDTPGKRAYDSTVANTRQSQMGAPGQYLQPDGTVTTSTAGTAVAQGTPLAAASSDAQLAQVRQRIETEKDPVKRAQLVAQAQALAATPKEITPEQQAKQRAVDYAQTQRIYSTPQRGVAAKFGITDPAAFDAATDTEIDKRAYELANLPGNTYLKVDPAKAREAAIHDLMKNPTAEGMRLPTPAEVAQQRQPVRQRVATFGAYGDPRLDDYLNPYDKSQQPSAHMMIRMVPKDYAPPAAGAPATSGTPTTTNPAVPPPTVTTPPISGAVTPGSTAAQSATQLYGGPVPGATPSPSLGGRIVQGAQAIGNAGRAVNPTPMSPAQIYGSQPAAPGVPAAPAAVASGGAPPGSVGPAPAGSVEGQTGRSRTTGQTVVNRGGWMYPAQ